MIGTGRPHDARAAHVPGSRHPDAGEGDGGLLRQPVTMDCSTPSTERSPEIRHREFLESFKVHGKLLLVTFVISKKGSIHGAIALVQPPRSHEISRSMRSVALPVENTWVLMRSGGVDVAMSLSSSVNSDDLNCSVTETIMTTAFGVPPQPPPSVNPPPPTWPRGVPPRPAAAVWHCVPHVG